MGPDESHGLLCHHLMISEKEEHKHSKESGELNVQKEYTATSCGSAWLETAHEQQLMTGYWTNHVPSAARARYSAMMKIITRE